MPKTILQNTTGDFYWMTNDQIYEVFKWIRKWTELVQIDSVLVMSTERRLTHEIMPELGLSVNVSHLCVCVHYRPCHFKRWQWQIAAMIYVNPCHVTVTCWQCAHSDLLLTIEISTNSQLNLTLMEQMSAQVSGEHY